VGRFREGRRPPDPPTVHFGGRVVDALGKLVGDDDLKVVRVAPLPSSGGPPSVRTRPSP
jgi:hypothetical protein